MPDIRLPNDVGSATNGTIVPVKEAFPGWEVKRATLHQAAQIPNGGGSTAALYADPGAGLGRSATTGVSMKYDGKNLYCEYKGTAFIIPGANIIIAYL